MDFNSIYHFQETRVRVPCVCHFATPSPPTTHTHYYLSNTGSLSSVESLTNRRKCIVHYKIQCPPRLTWHIGFQIEVICKDNRLQIHMRIIHVLCSDMGIYMCIVHTWRYARQYVFAKYRCVCWVGWDTEKYLHMYAKFQIELLNCVNCDSKRTDR